jgi:spore germination protein
MYVHIVKKGENLLRIARFVGGSAEEIAVLNGLAEEEALVPGMSLLIPTQVPTGLVTYTVQAGDTLRRVARRFRVPEKLVQHANHTLPAEGLPPGRVLTVPVPLQEARAVEVNLRLEVQGDLEEIDTLREVREKISGLSVAPVYVDRDGSLILPEEYDPFLEMAAKRATSKQLLLLTPLEADAAERVLQHAPSRREFFSELRTRIGEESFCGVHLEFTSLPPELRFSFTGFVRELAARLHQLRGRLYVAVPPANDNDPEHPRWGAYDLHLLGQYADRIVWNADEGYGRWDSPPTSLAPLHLIRRSLRHAVTEVSARKLLLGLPFYGYDWEMPYNPDISPDLFLQTSFDEEAVVTEPPKQIHWDDQAMAPMFTYRDEKRRFREVWYEDVRSIAAKLELIREFGLGGLSCRVQGQTNPACWHLLHELFAVHI